MATWQYTYEQQDRTYTFNIDLDRSRAIKFRNSLKHLSSIMLEIEGQKIELLAHEVLAMMKKVSCEANENGELLYNKTLFETTYNDHKTGYRKFMGLEHSMKRLGFAMGNPLKKVILDADNKTQTFIFECGTEILICLEAYHSSFYLNDSEGRTIWSPTADNLTFVFDKCGIDISKVKYFPYIENHVERPIIGETYSSNTVTMNIYRAEHDLKAQKSKGYDVSYMEETIEMWEKIRDALKNDKKAKINAQLQEISQKKHEIGEF
ncbi:MAG: hypothetical protein ACRCRT_03010, partial [Cetobacterium somerae]